MQTITTGHSMEVISILILSLSILACLGMNVLIINKIDKIECRIDPNLRKNAQIMDNLFEDLGDIHQMTADILEKMNVLPDVIKEDNYRSMEAIKGNIEPTMPKTNNWDSVRKAFKGPSRIEIDERN